MRLVLAALTRPIAVVIALLAVALCAGLAIQRMPVNIFPQVGDPVIYVAQTYGGMYPAQNFLYNANIGQVRIGRDLMGVTAAGDIRPFLAEVTC